MGFSFGIPRTMWRGDAGVRNSGVEAFAPPTGDVVTAVDRDRRGSGVIAASHISVML